MNSTGRLPQREHVAGTREANERVAVTAFPYNTIFGLCGTPVPYLWLPCPHWYISAAVVLGCFILCAQYVKVANVGRVRSPCPSAAVD